MLASRVSARSATKAFKAAPVRPSLRSVRLVVQAKKDEVSESYAKALCEISNEKGTLEAVHSDMEALSSLVSQNAQLKELLYNPTVAADSKRAILDKLAEEAGFQTYTSNFMKVLVDKDRLSMLEQICESFEEQYCEITGTQVATVRSAVKLEQEQQLLIAKKLQELTGSKNIKLKPVLDQGLVAGFVVEFGSTQIDLSVRGQVEKYGEQLQKSVSSQFA